MPHAQCVVVVFQPQLLTKLAYAGKE